jgi:hypothetical protein
MKGFADCFFGERRATLICAGEEKVILHVFFVIDFPVQLERNLWP